MKSDNSAILRGSGGCDTMESMYITHSFVGTSIGRLRYLFFVLYEDYNDFDRRFVQEYHVYLERFARNLRNEGAVIQPFRGDIETTRTHILEKDWAHKEKEEIIRVPSLLMISKDFDDFSPRKDPWMVFHFGERKFGDHAGLSELGKTLDALTRAVEAEAGGGDESVYSIARGLAQERPELTKVFTAQPGVFGFSINLVEAGRQIREWISHRGRGSMGSNRV
jgi:hypothetical protein